MGWGLWKTNNRGMRERVSEGLRESIKTVGGLIMGKTN